METGIKTRCFEHLRNLENLPVAEERASDILRHWGLDHAPEGDLRGLGEGRVHRHGDGETVDTVGIKLGVFVQHLVKAREAGTREPDSYALGTIAPKPREGGRELRPQALGPTPHPGPVCARSTGGRDSRGPGVCGSDPRGSLGPASGENKGGLPHRAGRQDEIPPGTVVRGRRQCTVVTTGCGVGTQGRARAPGLPSVPVRVLHVENVSSAWPTVSHRRESGTNVASFLSQGVRGGQPPYLPFHDGRHETSAVLPQHPPAGKATPR